MRRADLADLTAFVAVADNLSFRAAASHIGVSDRSPPCAEPRVRIRLPPARSLSLPCPALRWCPSRDAPPKVRFAADSSLEGDGFEPLVPLLGRAQLSRHARGGPLPSADSLRIQLSSSMRSAAMKASGWSSMTWCLASGTSTTGARGPIRDDM
jgi:hypothetical protein